MASDLILTVFHQPESSSERLGDRLKAQGYRLERCCPAAGDALPRSLDPYAGVIVFGGAMSANDDHLAFIRDELAWLPSVIDAKIPLLGICLGAQLISRVLGGNVSPHQDDLKEIGYFPVHPTPTGQALFGPGEASDAGAPLFYHWNREGFDLPAGAELLATGQWFPHQAFRYGQNIYGLQFHPETTAAMLRRHIETTPGELLQRLGAQSEAEIWNDHKRQRPRVEGWIDRFLALWLEAAAPPRPRPPAPQPLPSKNAKKLEAKLRGQVGRAIEDYQMIEAGDRVMVCLSGGKDSYTMLALLRSLQRKAPVDFEILAVNLDQKQPGFPEHVLPEYFESVGVPYRIVQQDTYSTVTRVIPAGKTLCSLCSRLRRGVLYRVAAEEGASKIALGHHRDDMVETLFLNLFHGGQLKAMPPKLRTDDGQHTVIRPLAYCGEKEIARYARYRAFPIIPCNLCGSQTNLERVKIKQMLEQWEQDHPGRMDSLFRSLQNVTPSHLADPTLFDFSFGSKPLRP